MQTYCLISDYPTLFIGVRLLNCPLKSRDSNPLMDILLGNLRVYKAVIEERILHYKLYAHVSCTDIYFFNPTFIELWLGF
ncbi:hypothetical protein DPMN_141299 [Dreissena polymorpha]|uniref:Uncharacterized protein n=1 Tax=Dreissena polymorpha TaxID=45954 RepID=A0A9D4G9E6_DREPO|nr:hypothetical protein DPMN_141299 [Dreissena polymorpha]